MTVRHDGLTVSWLGYANARISDGDQVVYTDPGRYGTLTGEWAEQYGGAPHPTGPAYDARDGDLVVVTHDHHYDSDGVRRVASEDATVLVYEAVSADGVKENSGRDVEPPEELPYDIRRVEYGDELTINGIDVHVVPAYNQPDGPWGGGKNGDPLHPEGFGCGYSLTIDGTTCFWTGDSDVIDDHYDLDVSLFLPSISQSFTMNRHDAADLAESLDPDLVIPIHYNTFDDLEADSASFAADVAQRSIPVALDEGALA